MAISYPVNLNSFIVYINFIIDSLGLSMCKIQLSAKSFTFFFVILMVLINFSHIITLANDTSTHTDTYTCIHTQIPIDVGSHLKVVTNFRFLKCLY